MSDPRVTVIVAAYNGERFLSETLESVFAQDFDSFEVVFVDDGSQDRTGEIAQSFPVRYVRQENRGLPVARNAGLALAGGELVAFLDDDDVLTPTKLSVQVRYLDEHPETGCVLGRQEWILEDGVEIAVLPEVVLHKRLHGANMTMNAPTTHPMLRSLREKLERERRS